MAGLLQDVRFALRQLRKHLGFTITATAMLAVAIGANGTVLSWIDGTMLRPIPGARATGDLVSLVRGEWNPSPVPPLSYPDYRDLQEQNHSLSGFLAYDHDWITVTLPKRTAVALAERLGCTPACSPGGHGGKVPVYDSVLSRGVAENVRI